MMEATEILAAAIIGVIYTIGLDLMEAALWFAITLMVAAPVLAVVLAVTAAQNWRENVARRKRGDPTLPWRWR